MKILLSAGHQPGLDSGAIGQDQHEADDNVRMCDRIVHYLRSWGIDTIYMPNNVGGLQEEINWANANLSMGQGYAIQVHRNAGGGTGNEVWTTALGNQIPLASTILNAMTQITGLPSRGVRDINNYSPLGWITYVNAESVLIESRFIDRDSITDADDFLDAYAIACGIADFLQVPRRPSIEQEQKTAADNAAKAQADAIVEANRLAIIAEQAQAEALKAAEAKRLADIEAKRLADEARKIAEDKWIAIQHQIDADNAKHDAEIKVTTVDKENLSIIDKILRAIKNILNAIIGKKE